MAGERHDRLSRYCVVCGQLVGVMSDKKWQQIYHCCDDENCLVIYEIRLDSNKEYADGREPRRA